jgi:predicted TPR repeat methyltransferase
MRARHTDAEPSMPPAVRHRSSGDLLADRRLETARAYAAGGDVVAAVELAEQALELAPTWIAGHFTLADFLEAAAVAGGDTAADFRDRAIAAYREVLRLDPADGCGAGLRLARLGAVPVPAAPPSAFVRDLFDDYAGRFETSLVGALGYRGPERIGRLLDTHAAGRRFERALDLGCGTGLMARVIRERVGRLDGVDLAPAMIARARAGGLYDGLETADVIAATAARPPASLDLVTAADLFCYLGDLGPIFAAASRAVAPGGLFAFTTEAADDDEPGGDVILRDSLRWAHRRSYLDRVADAAGFHVVAIEIAMLRRDRDRELPGHFALLTRS